jgi:hypothetical protein
MDASSISSAPEEAMAVISELKKLPCSLSYLDSLRSPCPPSLAQPAQLVFEEIEGRARDGKLHGVLKSSCIEPVEAVLKSQSYELW